MVKGAKGFLKKYEEALGDSCMDKIMEDVKSGIELFSKRITEGTADGYFGTMYFHLLIDEKILFYGIQKSATTGDMSYMLNGIYQWNRFTCVFRNRLTSSGSQVINFIECVLAYACNDDMLLEKMMPRSLGPANFGYPAPYYNMLYAMTYHDEEAGQKAQEELHSFMEKKRPKFDLKLAKYFLDLYSKNVEAVNEDLQELCNAMSKCNWINEHMYGLDKGIRALGNTTVIFIHGLYHIAVKYLRDSSLADKVAMPEHKSFLKEYEEFNLEHDFPKPQNLIDFDDTAKFINESIRTEVIPEVSLYKPERNYVNDGDRFEKTLFQNLQKSGVLQVELEKEPYIFLGIK